ncbi:rhodanese-like domain-containing protein [Halarcobacter bivalviorum]|uniref:rhodanese-like domain-containing protein n=1 Tax=Halarcobacter bivalviorum TaxID=663364 RepID=UPI00100A3A81|nr:rhodanese-like domain-containing protein [Halarcobacter bivalviorum]RXK02943.1 hypothetical protein CRU97_13245 [Halarcobacter bivalviorum]
MKIFKFLSLAILFILLNSTFLNAQVKSVDVKELIELKQKGIKIIDIRKQKDIKETGIIPTSYRLSFYKKDGTINKEKWLNSFINLVGNTNIKFVLISEDGKKAKHGAELLQDKKGYIYPLYLEGGINAWIDAKEKLVKVKK